MNAERVQRRLAAILAADVAGYSRLMGEDEEGTFAALNAHLKELIEPCIAEHRGRVVKTTGDGLLVEFASVVDAVRCAVAFQEGMAERNLGVPEDRRVGFRIGVNLGDVIVQNDDVYGDGVNVAARLEGLCDVGAVYVSAVVHDQVEGKIDQAFDDLGEHAVKNIDKPVHIYRASPDPGDRDATKREVDKLLDRPAVAVLPFANMSGDADQEYFADGLTEDLITALSLWRSFPVISRNSVFAYKGQSPDIRTVAHELGVQYVIEGSVRRAAGRVRITVQLIDAESGHHLWAERYDRVLEDIFDLQDEITQHVTATVEPELSRARLDRMATGRTENLAAWDFYARGMSMLFDGSSDGHVGARELFEAAVRLDPTFSRALAMIGLSYQRDLYQGMVDLGTSLVKMMDASLDAVRASPRESVAHQALCLAYMWSGEHDKAISEGRRAVTLNPGEATSHACLGNALGNGGEYDEALRYMETGARLSPQDSRGEIFETVAARTNLLAHRYETAVEWARKALQKRPDYTEARLYTASSLGHLGRRDEVPAAIQLAALGPPDPSQVLHLWKRFKDPNAMDHILDGLRKAGLPE